MVAVSEVQRRPTGVSTPFPIRRGIEGMLGDKAMRHRHWLLDPLITLLDVVLAAVFPCGVSRAPTTGV
jgi:hypothetical protein